MRHLNQSLMVTYFDRLYYAEQYAPWISKDTSNSTCLQHYINYGYNGHLPTFKNGQDLLKKYRIKIFAYYYPSVHTEWWTPWKPLFSGHTVRKPSTQTHLKRQITQALNGGGSGNGGGNGGGGCVNGFCFMYETRGLPAYLQMIRDYFKDNPTPFEYCWFWNEKTHLETSSMKHQFEQLNIDFQMRSYLNRERITDSFNCLNRL